MPNTCIASYPELVGAPARRLPRAAPSEVLKVACIQPQSGVHSASKWRAFSLKVACIQPPVTDRTGATGESAVHDVVTPLQQRL
ncbi:hypothetical protein GN244_ATG03384 [Phytophthora infestans]|uniref:Uncharacterized protein n=1 Tax=Phytophthora infestans TaxID=4787 RepID=A0A833TDF4_PHYIN|nr:hypothetical protein GN244_ATG03384 [Phytophthora infestans]